MVRVVGSNIQPARFPYDHFDPDADTNLDTDEGHHQDNADDRCNGKYYAIRLRTVACAAQKSFQTTDGKWHLVGRNTTETEDESLPALDAHIGS